MDAFVLHALDLLAPLGAVRARAMMGGHLLYCGEIPVGLVYDERLYLKTDAETKGLFAAAGCEAFTYEMRGRTMEMSYWTAPDAALDDAEAMRPWAERALEAALRAREKKGRGRARAPFDSAALRSGRTEGTGSGSRSGSGTRSGSGSRSGTRSGSRSGSQSQSKSKSGARSTQSVPPERSGRKAGAESKGGRTKRTKSKSKSR